MLVVLPPIPIVFVLQSPQATPVLKLRVLVAPVEVKVQGVVQTAPTPSGAQVSVTLDLQQPTEFGTGLTEILTTVLVESLRFQVYEEAGKETATYTVKAAVTEFKLQRTLTGSQGQLAKLIDFSQGEATALVGLDIRVVENSTGLVRYSVRAEGKASSKGQSLTLSKGDLKLGNTRFESSPLGKAVREAIAQGVKRIGERMNKIPWEARVALVEDTEGEATRVYLNVGEDSGLKVGDVLELRQAGEPITDPETGRVLGMQRGKLLAEARVVELSPELTTLSLMPGTGVKRGDSAVFLRRPTP